MDGIDTSVSPSARTTVRPASGTSQTAPVAPVTAQAAAAKPAEANPIALLAEAAPIDTKKVEAIRALIGQGAYPIDARAIAAKMIALDVVVERD